MADVTCEVFESLSDLYNILLLDDRVSIGCPIDNTRVYIVDPDEQNVGELVVAGANVANGYHNIDATNRTLLNKFVLGDDGRLLFCTGDLGKIWNNRIIFFGRSDTQIKIAGNRVDLNEIELVIKRHCNCRQPIAEFVAVDVQIVVFLQATEQAIDLDRVSLAKYLPSFAVPSRFITVSEFPLLVSGKIDRHQLVNSLDIAREAKTKQEHIQSNRERAFFSALNEINIPRAYADRSFFAAGGASLTALSFVAKLHRIGFHSLTVERLLDASSLNDILLYQAKDDQCHSELFFECDSHCQVVPLEQVDKCEAIRIISESFANFGEIDVLVHQNRGDLKIEYKHQLTILFDELWSAFVANGLSFGIVTKSERLVGISLSNDGAHDMDIDLTITPLAVPMMNMFEAGEKELLEQIRSCSDLPQYIMRNFATTVNPDVEPEQRLTIMYHLERQTLRVATTNKFQALLTANTSSVTKQLAEHVFKFDENLVFYPSQWKDSSDNLVFPHADPNYTMIVSIKYIV